MNGKIGRFCLPLVLLALSQAAPAENGQMPGTDPWYVGIGIGTSLLGYNKGNIANNFSAATTASSYNHDDFTVNIFGGYVLDPLLSVEFGLTDLGNTIATTSGTSTKLFNIYSAYIDTIMAHRYNRNASLYIKVGAHFWDISTNSGSSVTSGTDLMLGTGVEMNLSATAGRVIRVEWTRYQFDRIYVDSSDTLTLDLVFRH